MNKLAISLLAGAAALVAGSAQAAPLNPAALAFDNGIENVRMVCDQFGRCWRERGQRRVIIRDSYNTQRYGYRQQYREPGVRLNVPGVSIGVGGGQRW